MSLAKKYLDKALQAQKDSELHIKKTQRLARDRFDNVLTLISGASSQGKTFIPYPSAWFDYGSESLEEAWQVYNALAEQLRREGFTAEVHSKGRVANTPGGDVQVVLNVDWSNPSDE